MKNNIYIRMYLIQAMEMTKDLFCSIMGFVKEIIQQWDTIQRRQ